MRLLQRGLAALQASPMLPGRARNSLLGIMGVVISKGAFVNHGVTIIGKALRLEDGAFINSDVLIDASAPVRIGRQVHVGHGARLVTATHQIGASDRRAGTALAQPIEIEDGVWIGAGAMVLPGVIIARGCVIGAGAVVTRNTLADGLYLGCPARRARDLPVK